MYKKTKIVATISDMRCDVGLIQRLYDAGMNVVRLNTAHQNAEGMKKVIDNVREVSSHLAILVDTKGPEVRTTATDAPIDFKKGEIVNIVGNPELRTTRQTIAVTYKDFVNDVGEGAHILIDDGDLGLVVDHKAGDTLTCHVENDATLGSRKSVNVPGVRINLPALTERDRQNIAFAISYDVAFIAHSFVRSAADVAEIRQLLDAAGSDIRIIAVYSVTRPGALEGVKYFLVPNLDNFSWMTVVSAMGQMFYSLSIAMGILITFGSYMKKDISIESSTRNVEVFDTAIAIMAGLMITPT